MSTKVSSFLQKMWTAEKKNNYNEHFVSEVSELMHMIEYFDFFFFFFLQKGFTESEMLLKKQAISPVCNAMH